MEKNWPLQCEAYLPHPKFFQRMSSHLKTIYPSKKGKGLGLFLTNQPSKTIQTLLDGLEDVEALTESMMGWANGYSVHQLRCTVYWEYAGSLASL